MKHILHIANDYSGSTVYKNLVRELDNLGIPQIVYNPIRDLSLVDKNKILLKNNSSKIIYSKILDKSLDRLFYRRKVKKIFKDIELKVNLEEIEIIHAHTWYSDGGVAYQLNQRYQIPYIITIRNTDLNLFLKFLIHERSYGLEILKHALKIIFISPVYYKRFKNDDFIKKIISTIEWKCEVIPNGVDEFWINNVRDRIVGLKSPIRLLYVGNFTLNKNVIRLLKAIDILNKNELQYDLKIVGKGGRQEKKVFDFIKNKEYFNYLGEVNDKMKLKDLFNNSDIFTMPSKSETFGLVYIEALSQGIPVLFSENEGIDGLYDNIGQSISPLNIDSIVAGIKSIVDTYDNKSFDPKQIVENHNWKQIAVKYLEIYSNK